MIINVMQCKAQYHNRTLNPWLHLTQVRTSIVHKIILLILILNSYTIGGPIQCVVSYRDQCAHKHTNMSLYK